MKTEPGTCDIGTTAPVRRSVVYTEDVTEQELLARIMTQLARAAAAGYEGLSFITWNGIPGAQVDFPAVRLTLSASELEVLQRLMMNERSKARDDIGHFEFLP